VRSSDAGKAVFRAVFPKVVVHGKQLFKDYSEAEFAAMEGALTILRERIGKAGRPFPLSLQQKEET
jgi:MarR family 2-MHQ and catechol resistance regulon transcriptional repressor